ncbi:hypothetical protein BDR03DRAFT_986775 [Suillus americanus]|nr:hypothetical protein BDR03DRAFT_986775 [Suillus americanus]
MVLCINSDTEEAPAPRPKRVAVPSAKVISADNAADQELLSHQIAHIANRAAVTLDPTDLDRVDNDKIKLVSPHTNKQLIKGQKQVAQSPDAKDVDFAQPPASDKDKEEDPLMSMTPPKKWQKKVPLPNADSVNAEGFLTDIKVVGIDKPSKPRQEQRSRNIDALFSVPYLKDSKKYRDCHACSKSHKCQVPFVNEVTTLRQHQEAAHQGAYLKWAKNNNFVLMLPNDAKRC